jgi:hypothetical protein
MDLSIAEKAVSLFPPLGGAGGWNAAFGRELNATDDRAAFQPLGRRDRERHDVRSVRLQPDRDRLPVVDGKHLEPFRVALDSVTRTIGAADARRLLRSDHHEHPRLAYRDVASATNKLTLIAAVLPPGCVSTHTVFCLRRPPLSLDTQYFLCGLFNSLVVNYLVRLRVTTHVTTATVERLPIPVRDTCPAVFREIAALARRLSKRFDAGTFAQLNARAARLYQLSTGELEHVLSTFPLISIEDRVAALKLFSGEQRR